MDNQLAVGDVFADKNVDRAGRLYKVVALVKKPEYTVRKDVAVCLVRGKATVVAVDRLLNASRFERVVETTKEAWAQP